MPTIAEDTLAGLVAAFNDPDPAVLEAFVLARSESVARVAPLWTNLRRAVAPVDVVRVEGVEPLAGFQEQRQGGVATLGHGGGAPGMNGDLIIHPQSGHAIAALSNFDPPQATALAGFVSLPLPAG